MRFAAISDVHGNIDALKAVLADIEHLHIAETINLGDHVSGPLAAVETADLLMSLALPSIRGNCDRTVVETSPRDMSLSDRAARAQLSDRHLDWLRSMPARLVFHDDVLLSHGTPQSDTTYWLEQVDAEGSVNLAPLDAIRAGANGHGQSLMLCGHSHVPRAVRIPEGPLIVNPGSVGLPAYEHDLPVPHVIVTGNPCASYAILEKSDGEWSVTTRLVPYDGRRMAAIAEAAGRPEWARAIATGWL